MKIYEFDAVIKKHDSIDATFVEFPYDVEKEFGIKGQVKVKAIFDDYEYRGSLVKMGHHCHCIGITQKIRKEINKQDGDLVHVAITKDDDPRIVEIPEDFKIELEENVEAKNIFDSLSYSNQKKFTEWITNAKKIETRDKRLKKTISMLLEGTKHP
ncbi:YdeI/OmpD-associated family protein [Gottschalkia purinilytica]|nr:YdeI/OmpD-associated family protein [Gottschalkia purinilytica]